jgi:hypothetical protein
MGLCPEEHLTGANTGGYFLKPFERVTVVTVNFHERRCDSPLGIN